MKAPLRVGLAALVLLLVWLAILSAQIVAAGRPSPPPRSDAAIVLGAAIYRDRPSPVFEERIKHAVALYRSGTVKTLIFTGGYGPGERHAESQVGRLYALARGIPASHVMIETKSRTTLANLVEARRLMQASGLRAALIVSDPLHIKRALAMAEDLGVEASGAPTPTSRYRSWRTKAGFLLRELYFYHHYLLTGQ